MNEDEPKLSDAVYEAVINGAVILSLSLGLAITAKQSGWVAESVSYQFIVMQSGALALIRFSTYLIQNDERIEAGNLPEIMVGDESSKGAFHPNKLLSFCKTHQLGKVI